jgi:hypothetical protein
MENVDLYKNYLMTRLTSHLTIFIFNWIFTIKYKQDCEGLTSNNETG